jgi:hypothetical protein
MYVRGIRERTLEGTERGKGWEKAIGEVVHCRGKGTMYNAFVLSFLLQHEYSKESNTF